MKIEIPEAGKPGECMSRNPDSPWQSAGAVLVPVNLAILGCALIPYLLQFSTAPAFASMRFLGGLALLYGMFTLIALAAIGKAGFIVCVPILSLACLLLPALLLARKLPWWVKLLTVAAELAALALMVRTVDRLHLQYLRGGFKGLN
jgi:hypothetical protein